MQPLGDRMKAYESEYNPKIPPYNPFIIRLDGKNFSKFTKGFKPPFDPNFTEAMVRTMNDLVREYNAVTGYTHSDEITLVFAPACGYDEYVRAQEVEMTANTSDADTADGKAEVPDSGGAAGAAVAAAAAGAETSQSKPVGNHFYDGRIIKICTVVSGKCSVRFAHHMQAIISTVEFDNPGTYNDALVSKVKGANYCFDARPIVIPHDKPGEIVNHMFWRSVYDCHRNAVSTYARDEFDQRTLHGKKSGEMIDMLREAGTDWDSDVPMEYKHGVYGKKELYEMTVEVGGKKIVTTRQRIVNRKFKIEYSDDMVGIMLAKYWPDDPIGDVHDPPKQGDDADDANDAKEGKEVEEDDD